MRLPVPAFRLLPRYKAALTSRSSMSYVASIDQGTSSSRVCIYDVKCNLVGFHQLEHTQFFPAPGHVEHNALDIYKNVKTCMEEAMKMANASSKDIKALGITNQRETTVVWNKRTGKPYHNAIVWNDSRTADICERVASEGGKDRLRAKTGLPISPYFSASKIHFLLANVPVLRIDSL